MKKRFTYLLLIIVLYACGQLRGQCHTHDELYPPTPCNPTPPNECGGPPIPKSFKFDISTGVDDGNAQLMPFFGQDDNWTILPPPIPCNPNPGEVPALCSNYRLEVISGSLQNSPGYCHTYPIPGGPGGTWSPWVISATVGTCVTVTNGPGPYYHSDHCPNDPAVIGSNGNQLGFNSYAFYSGPAFPDNAYCGGTNFSNDNGNLDGRSRLLAPADLLKCQFGHISPNLYYGYPWNCPAATMPFPNANTGSPFNNPVIAQDYPPHKYTWVYIGRFNIPAFCPSTATNVKFNFEFIGGGGVIDMIDVQGWQYQITAIGGGKIRLDDRTSYHCPNNDDNRCQSLDIPISQFATGPNGYVEIKVHVSGDRMDYPGLILTGNLEVTTPDFVDFTLKDKNGNKSGSFCFGEDVFLDGSNSNFQTSNYTLKLFDQNGTLLASSAQAGAPAWVNVTSIFSSYNFQPNITYSVSLENSGSSCGTLEMGKKFSFNCCNTSADASFDIKYTEPTMTLKSTFKGGTHSWQIYSAQNAETGPYNLFVPPGGFVLNMNDFSLSLESQPAPCYVVKHTLVNSCGTFCKEESICKPIACEDGICKTSAPTLPSYQNGALTWNSVSGATSYIVQVTVDGCSTCSSGSISLANVYSIPVPLGSGPSNSYTFQNGDFGSMIDGIPSCFSMLVFAVCQDGTLSAPSNKICSQ